MHRPHLLTGRRRSCRGAAAVLVVYAAGMLALAGAGSIVLRGITQTDARVQSAADAAAHAAESTLIADAERFSLSAELQGHRVQCLGDWTPPDDRDPDVHLDTDLCRRAHRAASSAAAANEKQARMVSFAVVPDTRDLHLGNNPGLLDVVVAVAIPRQLPVVDRDCVAPEPQGKASDLCWAMATAGAQPAG